MNLTWIRPTANSIHLWNYFWAIKPLYDFAIKEDSLKDTYIFIADLHWLAWNDNFKLKENILNQYAIYKAIWFKNIFLQSDVLEITQIEKYFSSFINLGKLGRLHTIKEKLKDNKYGTLKLDLFSYPVLMAADIAWINAKNVFLWKDQKQHLEVTKEIIKKINRKLKINFIVPNWIYFTWNEVIWLDWRKMSKSYNNYIDPFATSEKILKKINKIKTNNIKMGIDKNYNNCNIGKLFSLFNSGENELVLREKYKNWLVWYGESKKLLHKELINHFKEIKKRKENIVNKGWNKARKDMLKTWNRVKRKYKQSLEMIKNKILN